MNNVGCSLSISSTTTVAVGTCLLPYKPANTHGKAHSSTEMQERQSKRTHLVQAICRPASGHNPDGHTLMMMMMMMNTELISGDSL